MKLKEIKPGMVIHCITEDEANALLNHLAELGHKWISGAKLTDHNNFSDYGGTCYVVRTFVVDYGNKDFYEQRGYKITEFSDLIIPELTAEEVVKWIGENYTDDVFCEVFGTGYLDESMTMDELIDVYSPEEIVEKIAEWKFTHEKKEPEVEWVYRVYNGESEEFVNSEEKAISECEFLAKDNPEKYAFYQKICRVKAVN